MEDDEPFLGVGRSLAGKRWHLRPVDERLSRALCQRHELPEIVGRALAARQVALDEAEAYLNPTLRSLLPDPSVLKDMDRAADRIARAIRSGEPVAVFGDYDVDGATSSALLRRYFRAVGTDLRLYIPDRVAEGYGPNALALQRLAEEGIRLVVTVDCGTTAHEPLSAAAAAGLDVVVLDHHTAEARLPPAFAVVNPNRLDEGGGLGQLAACGVTFLALVAVNRALRAAGHFAGRSEPDLLAMLDLVALGTICDVVPLTGLNRALVAQGLKVMGRRGNLGLVALCDLCRVTERVDAYHAGFILGPRVNAGGRIGQADLGAILLSTDDAAEAAAIAARLNDHNDDRKAIEGAVLAEAIAQVESTADSGPVVMAAGEGWHPGVIGIVAGRLKERYNRPACVVALSGGVGKASGRSMPGIYLGAAVIEARQAGLLMNGGGHRMAAGFTVREERLDELRAFLSNHIHAQAAGPLTPTLELDGALAVGAATPALAATLARLGPFGAGNAEPRFALTHARVVHAKVVGTGHVSCFLTGADGGRLRAIAFRALDGEVGRALLAMDGAPLHLAGTLRLDHWNGEDRVQLHIDDAAPVWMGKSP
ncbi:MAG TPA: single-stranded-DNA-specific exonuclease RecJ [Alphaproteobacteria bacterium]|nr:single-stranded-DNA-specific exonuclease RecJ [Alphaproteobacteria bacterium]